MKDIYELLQPIDFIIVVAYIVILTAIGYWASFVKKKKTDEHLFLAQKTLTWPSIGFTMWGTNVGPSMLIASASIGFTTGVVAGNFGWYAFVFIFLLALIFAPRYLGAGVNTLPEYMGKRFSDSTRTILAWYSIATILISWLALTLFAGGILVTQILNVPLWLSVILLLLVAGFFTIAGGLKAIAYTNVFQMILLIVVSLILTVVGVSKVGGFGELMASTPDDYWNLLRPGDDPVYPWYAIIFGYPVMGVWFWCTDQSMVQSVLGAKNLRQGQMGANFTGWLKILDVAIFIIPGIVCFALFPDLDNPDEAYMTMVTRLFPAGMTGLVMAVLIAALISTIDSALNSLSTVFTVDIYVKKHKPDATNRQIVRIGRIVTLAGAAIAVLMTLAIDSIKGLNLFDIFQAILGFIAPPMTVVFLLGVLWKGMTTRAANLILSLGTFISIGTGVLFLWVFPQEQYDFWPHFLFLSFLLFLVLAAIAVVVSLTDKNGEKSTVVEMDKNAMPRQTTWQWIMWGLLFTVMIGLYIYFNGF